ncbi:MAG TPA: S-layer homology domain-containing protein [Vicinamibacteria bacterium]|nr:S-layer homology domain-containing protein [Vicinamibacteria bacterium]
MTDYSQYKELPRLVPGDTAFYKNNFPAPLNVKTAPLATLTFTTVGANTAPLFAMTFNNSATTLYAVDNTTRQLGTINQTTGAFTSIATVAVPAGFTVTGLAFDPTNANQNQAYFTATNGATAFLWRIDVTTGVLTNQVTITGFPFTIDIAIDRTGQMYGHDIAQDVLLRIDKNTGTGTSVGPTGMNANFAQGMMYDNSDDTLYGCAFVIVPAQQGQLVRFNKTSGAATIVAGPVPDELECGVRVPAVRMTAVALTVDAAGNRVMDPGETVIVAPSWRNDSSLTQTAVTGTMSNFIGPAGGTYTINDNSAAYGDIAANQTATCTTNCYGLTAAAATRPVQHWDTTVDEALSVAGQNKTWTLHVGGSFTDVPPTSGFYRFIETLFHRGITGGCGTDIYCPTSSTTREQMAVFVLISKEGAGYAPPACAPPNLFSDVPDTSPFCRFIEELANRQVVTGCGPNLYCPQSPVTREQMAIFVLRTLDPTLNPPACTTPMFNDVPAASLFCRWIEELARRGVVTGCGGGNYCPQDPVTREQMGVFLSATFGLTLYGV